MLKPAVLRVDAFYVKAFWWTLLLAALIKVALCFAIPVTGDEAYYAIWGEFPALGYYDHTPFIGWLLWPFVKLSLNPLVLRLPTIIMTSLIGWGIFAFLKNYEVRKAALAAIIFLVSPLSLLGVIITTDTPVILFSFLSGLCFLQALKKNDHAGWFVGAGVFLGLAFFSKYFAVLLALAYALFLLIAAPKPRRVMGLLIMFLCTLPFGLENIYWNYHHAWANILFNVYNRNVGDHAGWHTVLTYLLTLFYIVTPPLFYYLGKKLKGFKETKPVERYALHFLIATPLLFFLVLSVTKEIGLHWPLSFITFIYLWAGLSLDLAELGRTLKFMLWFSAVHLLLIAVAVFMPMQAWQKLPISPKTYVKLVYLFEHAPIREHLNQYNKDYVFTSLNYVQADMMYYDSGLYAPTFGVGSVHGRQDDFITDFRHYAHRNFLIFYTRPPRPEEYQPYFSSWSVKQFSYDDAKFYYVLGKDFNYPAYRDRVLKEINDTYWQVPGWLPHRPSFFCRKYFPEDCH